MGIPDGGLVLGMELYANEPPLLGQFHDLHEVGVRVHAREAHALLQQLVAKNIVYFVAVPVALLHHRVAVDRVDAGVLLDPAVVLPEAHGPALVRDFLLLLHEVDDGIGRVLVELGRVGPVPAAHVPRKLDDGALQAQTDAEEGEVVLAGVPGGLHFALDATIPEAGGHQDARHVPEYRVNVAFREVLREHRPHVHLHFVGHTGKNEAFGDGFIGVLVLHVLPDQGDGNRFLRVLELLQKLDPVVQLGSVAARVRVGVRVEPIDDELAHPFVSEEKGHLVDRLRVEHLNDRLLLDIAEEGDFASHVRVDGSLRAADNRVRLEAVREHLLHGMLSRLRLKLPRRAQVRNKSEVRNHRVVGAEVVPQLADGLQVGLALNVPDRAADLGDHDVVIPLLPQLQHPVLNLVDDVGNHLHGLAQVRAFPFLGDDLHVDPSGGDVVGLAGGLVQEALVVSQVEVRLCSVVGHVHLAVLVRVHRPRVDVDVGIELLDRHVEPPVGEQAPERGAEDALPQGGCDAAGDEDVFGLHETRKR